ncbi:S8 family peptidase [Natrialba sp. SSL1]|uniref:S8 family peptidase n=1 Tax=Natrialba sp. SSL1 TaxID=1869245 RepID=UPI0008F85F6F|nr:S8 family serine peptidase [Natrialba sp. SSL1]OIB56695.1 subtilase [Natrialba sp. SSL1]
MDRTEVVVVLCVLLLVSAFAGGLGYLALAVGDGAPTSNGPTAGTIDVDETIEPIHTAGTTGENVSVGVLDVTGFDREYPLLEDRVVAAAGFGDDIAVDDSSGGSHGTAVAATIARIAPDADLHLATFETPEDYEDGLEWLVDRDVDVIVAPVADAGTLGDGSSKLARATAAATEQSVVVAPAGNLGTGHWTGTYSPDESGARGFEGGPLNEVRGPNGHAEFHLSWDDPDETYQLELYRLEDDGSTTRVAQSLPREYGDVPGERLTAQLDDDTYGLAVRGPGADTEITTNTRIRVTSSTHSLADGRSSGSIAAPAAAPDVLSVGAINEGADEVAPYSSRGPTTDGRLGVDVVAPDSHPTGADPTFDGTSASAAYVGGVAALVVDAGPELSPEDVRRTLASTAEPTDGVDTESGRGQVDPRAAVAAVDDTFEATVAVENEEDAR